MGTPGTLNYPTSLDDSQSLFEVANSVNSTLTADISDVAVVIPVVSTSSFPPTGAVSIGDEVIYYTSKDATNLNVNERGADNSTASAHTSGTSVEMRVIARQHEILVEAILAIQNKVGTGVEALPSADTVDTISENLTLHTESVNNPHSVTKAQVGLPDVDNTADTAKPVSTAQQTALDLKANIANPTFTGTVGGITKSMVGLDNVDNTSDTSKPVSTAQQTALNLKANLAGPTFTGVPAAPTAAAGTNTTQLATTAFVTTADNLKAPLASPTFTGTPAAPTATAGTNTTQLATTAFVAALGALKANLASPTFTGTPLAPTASAATNNTQIATTAYVTSAASLKANLASPTFTGTPLAPTAVDGTNTTQIATTAFVTSLGNTKETKAKTVATKTANYTALITDDYLLFDTTGGDITCTLPSAATATRPITIKKIIEANNLTIDPNAAELIEGASSLVITAQWVSLTLVSNGTSWFVANGYTV